jgi:hypothetical protein
MPQQMQRSSSAMQDVQHQQQFTTVQTGVGNFTGVDIKDKTPKKSTR